LVRKINYDENPFLSQTALDVIEAKRLESYEEFQHIYLGVPLENNDQSLIKSSWIEAAVDAHIKLGINIEGKRVGSLDVADEGSDLNAFAIRHGILIESVDTWSGKGGDIYASTEQAFRYCDLNNLREFNFDSDGLGAGVRGDARIINEGRAIKIEVTPFRGSASVINANKDVEGLRIIKTRDIIERKNIDFFANYKAQSWYSLRLRFERTYRAVVHGEKYDPEMLISLNSKMQNLNTLKLELEPPVFGEGGSGKMKVDKAPDDQKSPNMADSVMMAFAPQEFRSSLF
jgi:phage terminase large subunit